MTFPKNRLGKENLRLRSADRGKLRLSLRISAVLTLIFTLCVLTFSLFAWMATSADARRKESAAFNQSKIWVQKVFAEPIWSYDEDLLEDLARVMVASPDEFVRDLYVKDRDGITIVEVSDGSPVTTDDIVEEFPILHQGETVGSVTMRARPQGIWEIFEGLQMLIWTAAALVSVTIAIVSFLVLERLLSRPLAELIENLDQVEKANYKIRLKQVYSAELETLAKAFQRAIGGIEQRDRELSRHTSNLADLVEARTQERDKERMNALHAAKLASIGEISAGLAHEINNPLTVIQGTVSLLEHQIETSSLKNNPDSGAMNGHLEKISAMVQRITRIVKSLKYFAREGANDPSLEFSANSMLKEVQSLMTMQMNQSRVSFYVELPAEEIRLSGQEVQLSQVVVILLQNALDAVRGRIEATITLRLRGTQEHCLIQVEDNGEGLTDIDENKIFQPFFTTKAVGEGTGLGLSIAHGIVKQHEGIVRVASRGSPTLFEISIPRLKERVPTL